MKRKKLSVVALLFMSISLCSFLQLEPIAPTPPMGWMSWNPFIDKISEQVIMEVADSMVSTGLRDAGYTIIQLDDGWMARERDENGCQFADTIKFPHGMKYLADYLHSKGLKFGVYSSCGVNTCEGYPGSFGNEEVDAHNYASWGVDYLKYDACGEKKGLSDEFLQTKMSNALKATGKSILFNICIFYSETTHLWGVNIADVWRTGGDIVKNINQNPEVTYNNWYGNLNQVVGKESYAGKGHWNDPDNLIIGFPRNNKQTLEEQKAQFCFWSLIAAPLIIGADVRKLTAEEKSIYLNKEVIAINQDKNSKQGYRVVQTSAYEIWVKPMDDGSKTVILFNKENAEKQITLNFSDIGLIGSAKIRDVWNHANLGRFKKSFSANVPVHGVVMIRLMSSAVKN